MAYLVLENKNGKLGSIDIEDDDCEDCWEFIAARFPEAYDLVQERHVVDVGEAHGTLLTCSAEIAAFLAGSD